MTISLRDIDGELLDWRLHHPRALDLLGIIPSFLLADDPRRAADQINERYAHGGEWMPCGGFVLNGDNSLTYPGDPPMQPVASARLRDELILVYPYAFVAILASDGSFEVSRLD